MIYVRLLYVSFVYFCAIDYRHRKSVVKVHDCRCVTPTAYNIGMMLCAGLPCTNCVHCAAHSILHRLWTQPSSARLLYYNITT